MRFYASEKISAKQSLTPEGYLVCTDAVLARTGLQIYGPGETPLEPSADGLVYVERDAEQVFRQETIDSFHGKHVVNDHPELNGARVDLSTDNWKDYVIGTVINPHRGVGVNDDLLLGDLMIYDRDAIDLIRSGMKRELSCGYDAEYQMSAPGRGRQVDIIGNHVALVDRGRCGPRCAIGDRSHHKEKKTMTVMDRVKAAFRRRDEKAFDEAIAELDEPRHSVRDRRAGDAEEEFGGRLANLENNVKGIGDKVNKMFDSLMGDEPPWLAAKKDDDGEGEGEGKPNPFEKKANPFEKTGDEGEGINSSPAGSTSGPSILSQLELEAPPGTAVLDARRARDSRYLEDSYQETLAIAEILVPGIDAPSFKVADAPSKSVSALCGFRRKVLDAALKDDTTRGIITEVAGENFSTKKCSCADARSVFRAAGALKRAANNGMSRVGDEPITGPGGGLGIKSKMKSIADINAANRERYKSA